MKLVPLCFITSLLANTALLTALLICLPKAKDRHYSNSYTGTTTGADLVAVLNANDPVALRDILRAAGWPDDKVRSLVSEQIQNHYRDHMKAFAPKPDVNQAWWRNNPDQGLGYKTTRQQREGIRRLHREAMSEKERVLGQDAFWQDPLLDFLPLEKRGQVQHIQREHDQRRSDVHNETQGFYTPSDWAELNQIQEKQNRAIAAVLSKDELYAYDLRMSQTAKNLRSQMSHFATTEAEYSKIFLLQRAFDEKYPAHSSYGPPIQHEQSYWKERNEAEKQLKGEIKEVIGKQRYKDAIRAQDRDYQQLKAAARRYDLPIDTAARLYELRHTVAAGALQIDGNDSISFSQKKQAIAELVDHTRGQVRSALGREAADAYFKNGGMGWLKVIEEGNVIFLSDETGGWGSRPINPYSANKK